MCKFNFRRLGLLQVYTLQENIVIFGRNISSEINVSDDFLTDLMTSEISGQKQKFRRHVFLGKFYQFLRIFSEIFSRNLTFPHFFMFVQRISENSSECCRKFVENIPTIIFRRKWWSKMSMFSCSDNKLFNKFSIQ